MHSFYRNKRLSVKGSRGQHPPWRASTLQEKLVSRERLRDFGTFGISMSTQCSKDRWIDNRPMNIWLHKNTKELMALWKAPEIRKILQKITTYYLCFRKIRVGNNKWYCNKICQEFFLFYFRYTFLRPLGGSLEGFERWVWSRIPSRVASQIQPCQSSNTVRGSLSEGVIGQ